MRPPKGTLTRTICESGCLCPYTPCRSLNAMKSVESHSPAWKRLTCASKSSNSSGRMSMIPLVTGMFSVVVIPLSFVFLSAVRADKKTPLDFEQGPAVLLKPIRQSLWAVHTSAS